MAKAKKSKPATLKDIQAVKADVQAVKKDVKAVREDVHAVKADVQAVKKDVKAVREDVQAVKADVQAVKKDMAAFEKRVDAKIDKKFEEAIPRIVKEVTKGVMDQMEVLLENRAADLLGVTGDEVKLMKDKQQEHEERLTVVEQKIGLRA